MVAANNMNADARVEDEEGSTYQAAGTMALVLELG